MLALHLGDAVGLEAEGVAIIEGDPRRQDGVDVRTGFALAAAGAGRGSSGGIGLAWPMSALVELAAVSAGALAAVLRLPSCAPPPQPAVVARSRRQRG